MSYLFNKYTNVIWAIARVWFGIDWMTHGIEKITKGFDSTGFLTIPALVGSLLMNLNFLWAGVISSNPSYVAIAIILLLGWRGTQYYGLDTLVWKKVFKKKQMD